MTLQPCTLVIVALSLAAPHGPDRGFPGVSVPGFFGIKLDSRLLGCSFSVKLINLYTVPEKSRIESAFGSPQCVCTLVHDDLWTFTLCLQTYLL